MSTRKQSSPRPAGKPANSQASAGSSPPSRYAIQIHRSTRRAPTSAARLRQVVAAVLHDERVAAAEISVAVVDDAEIHRVNREHLDHDCPTDVISFLYSAATDATVPRSRPLRRGAGLALEGELVVSGETATRAAPAHCGTPASELELYIIHGVLHLCGYDDLTPTERRVMRRRERELIALLARQPD